MILYAVNPDTVVSPTVIITLGSIAFITGMLEVTIEFWSRWTPEQIQAVIDRQGEYTYD